MSQKGKILLIRGGAIGDFILTLPVISALRQQFPEAHVEVLGYPHIVELAVANGLADRAQSIEARMLAGFFAHRGELASELARYFAEFDLIISYLYDPDLIFRTNVARCTKALFINGPHRPDEAAGVHATQVFLKPLERLAIFEPDPVPRLGLKGAPVSRIRIALHPGSGSEQKNWPEGNWAQLLEMLVARTSFELLLVGGEAEGGRLQRLAAALPPQRTRVAQSLALTELAGLLEPCSAFIGHDSGITHLAAALNVPLLVLWGETSQAVWAPQARQVVVLRPEDGLPALKPEAVWGALSRFNLQESERGG